jgi:hypothetical protein
MNNKKWIKSAMITLFIVLTGCGGSSDPDSTSGNHSNNGSMNYVYGQFKTASTPDESAPTDYAVYGLSSGVCVGESNYFESENILIYGSTSLPDSDFQHAATMVENQLNQALNLMGVTHAEFDNYRPHYTPQVAAIIFNFLLNNIIEPHEIGITVPNNWLDLSIIEQESILRSYWNDASDSKQTELVNIYQNYFGINDLTVGNKLPSKIGVCLDSSMNEIMFGQGTLLGMNLPPQSVATRADAEKIVLHELIHTIQHNVGTPIDAGTQVNDRWFMEGQATFLAGQQIARSADNHYPVNVVDSYDAGQEFGSDDGLAYQHYAKAYSFLDAHSGKDRILQLLLDVRNYQGTGDNFGYLGISSNRFSEAFDANLLKADGSQLTLNEFRQNYHSFH